MVTRVFIGNDGTVRVQKDRPPIPHLLKLENFKLNESLFYNFAINDVGVKIFADPIDGRELIAKVSDRIFIIIAPIKCTSKIVLEAASIIMLAPVECTANRVYIKCTNKIVAFGNIPVAPNVEAKSNFRRCELSDFRRDRLVDLLSEVKKTPGDLRLLFNGVVECWLQQTKFKNQKTYSQALKFFGFKYDDFRSENNPNVRYFVLDPNTKISYEEEKLPEKFEIHFKVCSNCKRKYESLSSSAKDYFFALIKYVRFKDYLSTVSKEENFSNQYLEGIGLLDKCDLKKPIHNTPFFYTYPELEKIVEDVRRKWIRCVATEDERSQVRKLIEHTGASERLT